MNKIILYSNFDIDYKIEKNYISKKDYIRTRFCAYISAFICTISFANQLPSQMYRTEAIAKADPKPVRDLLDYMKKTAAQDSPSFCMNYDHQYVNLSYDRASIHVSKAAILVIAFELARAGWNLMFNANPEYKDLPNAVKNQLRGYTQEDFRYYFETFFNKSTHLFTEFEHLAILRQYPLYQFIEFVRYIQILPHYCEYMILIAHQHSNQFTLRYLICNDEE